jgi:hypothetical protein
MAVPSRSENYPGSQPIRGYPGSLVLRKILA